MKCHLCSASTTRAHNAASSFLRQTSQNHHPGRGVFLMSHPSPTMTTTFRHRRPLSSTTDRSNNPPPIPFPIPPPPPSFALVEPIDSLLVSIGLFRNGLSRLMNDVWLSVRIREAELSRVILRRKVVRENDEIESRRIQGGGGHVTLITSVDRTRGGGTMTTFPLPSRPRTTTTTTTTREEDDGLDSDRRRHRRRRPFPGWRPSDRRSREHLRRVRRDLSISLPTAAAFVLVPFVGYAFVFLGMAFPRLLLSRQFHTWEQRYDFGTTEYRRRRDWYETLSNGDFWGCCMTNVPGLVLLRREEEEEEEEENGVGERIGDDDDVLPFSGSLSYLEMDAAGPVFDERSMLTLYRLIRRNYGRDGPGECALSSVIGNLQPSHLHHLSLSNNLASSLLLPPPLASAFLQICLPCVYLVRRLTNLAEDVILDDAALIEEGMSRGDGCCAGMTDEEVYDACWIRGLPLGPFAATTNVGVDFGGGSRNGEARATRRVLTNHLRMMEAVMSARCGPSMVAGTVPKDEDVTGSLRSRGELVRDATLQLLVLHLHPIRYGLMRNSVIKN